MSDYIRRGDWLISPCGRWRISRLELYHGWNYSAFDWYPDNDWAPRLLGVRDTSKGAKGIIDAHRR